MITRLAQQLGATLEDQILDGRWKVGDRLPPERDLASQHGVSRSTLREALDDLERTGLIVRHQGRGTFVAPRRLEQSLLGHFSIMEALKASGRIIGGRVIGERVVPASRTMSDELQLSRGEKVLYIERLRLVDRVPFMVERTWLPLKWAAGLDAVDLTDRNLYEILVKDYGITLVRAVESFEPVVLHEDEAEFLDRPPGSPALLLLRTSFDQSDVPVVAAHAVLRADVVRTLVERKVDDPPRT